MNIFRALASGKQKFREEFISAFLAYLLSPKMDHGLGPLFVTNLLTAISEATNAEALKKLAGALRSRLREDIFGAGEGTPVVELEVAYPNGKGSSGYIDIVVRCDDWFLMIENKILINSKTTDQLRRQYQGFKEILKQKPDFKDRKVLVVFLVPAMGADDSWTVPQDFYVELDKVLLHDGDTKALVTWQPTDEDSVVSIVAIIRDILRREAEGMLPPISFEVRQTLLSLVDFSMNNFEGFPYQKTTGSSPARAWRWKPATPPTGRYAPAVRRQSL